jgi:hypothetical protein
MQTIVMLMLICYDPCDATLHQLAKVLCTSLHRCPDDTTVNVEAELMPALPRFPNT